jgi:hypothetical protein
MRLDQSSLCPIQQAIAHALVGRRILKRIEKVLWGIGYWIGPIKESSGNTMALRRVSTLERARRGCWRERKVMMRRNKRGKRWREKMWRT